MLYKDDDFCFACGRQNPSGLHMQVERGHGQAAAEVTLKREHQGWSEMAHGGLVSTLLDEIMAHAVIDQHPQAATVELKVRFSAPVPLNKPLRVIGRITNQNKKLVLATAELKLQESNQVLARAESKFLIHK